MPEENTPENPENEPKSDASPAEEAKKPKGVQEGDASRGEVAIYAFGNVEGAIADRFPDTLQSILIVVAHMNPLLIGLVLSVRQLWDAIMDPVVAHISDNTKSRWGRRRPYILVGGVSRVLFLLPFIALMPIGTQISGNALMEAQNAVNDGSTQAVRSLEATEKIYWQYPEAGPEEQQRMENILTGNVQKNAMVRALESMSVLLGKSSSNEPYLDLFQRVQEQLNKNLPVLEEDLAGRQALLKQREEDLQELKAQDEPEDSKAMQRAIGLVEESEERVEVATNLIKKGREGLAKAIAGEYLTRYLLKDYGELPSAEFDSIDAAQEAAQAKMKAEGLEPIPLVQTVEPVEVETTEEPVSIVGLVFDTAKDLGKSFVNSFKFEGIQDGWKAFMDPANFEQRKLVVYLLIGYLIFATLATVNAAPYYALGIELSPSYEGRTQVVVYRSIMNKIVGLIQPWVPVFCFSLLFANAFDALFWVAAFACVIGIPSTVLMFFKTRERTHATIKKAGERPNLFKSAFQIAKEKEFLRILFLWVFIGLVNGLFQQIGLFLNIYWVMGSALSGAALGAAVSMLAWLITFIQLPIIKWACDKFQKHRVMMFGIVWMAIGTVLKWWLMDPDHPEYQFILPFFFAIGISTVYTVLPAMMADVTDLDELKHGVRREGMFGAVMAFLMKSLGTITPIAAGAILVATGFNAELEYRQVPETILKMRMLFSFVPGVMLLGALVAIWKYPLTRDKVREIKAVLKKRHEDEDPSQQADTDPTV